MSTELTEEEMRRALFGNPTQVERVSVTPVQAPVPEIATAQPVKPQQKKKVAKAFTPRLKVTLRVGNEFEGKTYEMIHEADTLSTLLAEQEAVKAARKKYRFVDVVSVKSMQSSELVTAPSPRNTLNKGHVISVLPVWLRFCA